MNQEIGLWERLNKAAVTTFKTVLVIALVLGIPALVVAALYGAVMLISMAWHAGAH